MWRNNHNWCFWEIGFLKYALTLDFVESINRIFFHCIKKNFQVDTSFFLNRSFKMDRNFESIFRAPRAHLSLSLATKSVRRISSWLMSSWWHSENSSRYTVLYANGKLYHCLGEVCFIEFHSSYCLEFRYVMQPGGTSVFPDAWELFCHFFERCSPIREIIQDVSIFISTQLFLLEKCACDIKYLYSWNSCVPIASLGTMIMMKLPVP